MQIQINFMKYAIEHESYIYRDSIQYCNTKIDNLPQLQYQLRIGRPKEVKEGLVENKEWVPNEFGGNSAQLRCIRRSDRAAKPRRCRSAVAACHTCFRS